MKSLHVSYSLSFFLAVSHCLSLCHGASACLSLSLWMLAVSQISWSCYMPLSVSYGYWLSLTVPPSSMELLHVTNCLL